MYVHVLSSRMLLPTAMVHLRDNPETIRNPRLVELLKEEGWETEGVFEDEYGDVHDWNTDTNVQHFLCRCLYLHYTQHVSLFYFLHHFRCHFLYYLPYHFLYHICRNRRRWLLSGKLTLRTIPRPCPSRWIGQR